MAFPCTVESDGCHSRAGPVQSKVASIAAGRRRISGDIFQRQPGYRCGCLPQGNLKRCRAGPGLIPVCERLPCWDAAGIRRGTDSGGSPAVFHGLSYHGGLYDSRHGNHILFKGARPAVRHARNSIRSGACAAQGIFHPQWRLVDSGLYPLLQDRRQHGQRHVHAILPGYRVFQNRNRCRGQTLRFLGNNCRQPGWRNLDDSYRHRQQPVDIRNPSGGFHCRIHGADVHGTQRCSPVSGHCL